MEKELDMAFWKLFPRQHRETIWSELQGGASFLIDELSSEPQQGSFGYYCGREDKVFLEARCLIKTLAKRTELCQTGGEVLAQTALREMFEFGLFVTIDLRIMDYQLFYRTEELVRREIRKDREGKLEQPFQVMKNLGFINEADPERPIHCRLHQRDIGKDRPHCYSIVEPVPLEDTENTGLFRAYPHPVALTSSYLNGEWPQPAFGDLSRCEGRSAKVTLFGQKSSPIVSGRFVKPLSPRYHAVVKKLLDAYPLGITNNAFEGVHSDAHKDFIRLCQKEHWQDVLIRPGKPSMGGNRIL
jgi:hypothetical protein